MTLPWLLALLGCPGDPDWDDDGFVEPADCDDNDPEAYPGAEERAYDTVDQDCDGSDLVDRDGDGFQANEAGGPDCNDFSEEVFPGAEEIPYDGIDNDCDVWPDDDYDHDGFAARGEGGEDCDDFDPKVIPLDLDGDGYTGCTGDCDDGDPLRNERMPPICGNGYDDDCDEIGDCALVGIGYLDAAEGAVVGVEGTVELGWRLGVPGDLDGDGVDDLVASAVVDGSTALAVLPGPFEGERTLAQAYASLDVGPGEILPMAVGDLEGDARAELFLGAQGIGVTPGRAWLLSPPGPGVNAIEALALLEVQGGASEYVGQAATVLGDRLVIGAPGWGPGAAELLPLDTRGVVAFGETGAVLRGRANEFGGGGLHAYDHDRDGQDDLVFVGTGDLRETASAVYVVPEPPRSGVVDVGDVAVLRVDTHVWGRAGRELGSGDLTGDGGEDLLVGAPTAFRNVGAVGVITEPLTGDALAEDLGLQWGGLGDDSFGASIAVTDYDGDGQDDVAIGAPATRGSGGGEYKPGAVHLWYGPVDAIQNTFSLTADLYLTASMSGNRTQCGQALVFGDLDGDGGQDLVVASPWSGSGRVDVFPGGWTGLYGW